MTERLVSISMCLTCPYFLEDGAGKDCLLCEKHFEDSFEGNYIPDWCTLQKADELPEWLKKIIESRISYLCSIVEGDWMQYGMVKAFRYVLSLRKPEKK